MKFSSFFITGTDTEVGKTLIASSLILKLQESGFKTVGYKPVAAGMHESNGNWINDDVENLLKVSQRVGPELQTKDICPYILKEPAAPHLVAEIEGARLDMQIMLHQYQALQNKFNSVVVEGAGGFLVPIDEHQNLGDFAQAIHLPVILVVNIKLGCINHALLTAEAIENRGLSLFAWVANSTHPEDEYTLSNIETLQAKLLKKFNAHFLGHIPFSEEIAHQNIYSIDKLTSISKYLLLK
jgi:dethiobiotin synthetase